MTGPTYCFKGANGGDVDLTIDREGSTVFISGTNETGDTISFVGTIDATGSLMLLNYNTNGSVSGTCETDDGDANLSKK
jgi:hypothetical protein